MNHSGPISCVASHGAYVATAGYDNRVILWDAATNKALAQGIHDHLVNHCSFSSDGLWLVRLSPTGFNGCLTGIFRNAKRYGHRIIGRYQLSVMILSNSVEPFCRLVPDNSKSTLAIHGSE